MSTYKELARHFENAALPYAAFSLRDDYYREMSRRLLDQMFSHFDESPNNILDVGAGVGISTLEIKRRITRDVGVTAVELKPDMATLCRMNFVGDLNVSIIEGNAEQLSTLVGDRAFDLVVMSEVVPILHPSPETSVLLKVFRQVRRVVESDGVLGFTLGPSNFEFKIPIADHRVDEDQPKKVMTELAHPLYRLLHREVVKIINAEVDSSVNLLWPPITGRMSEEYLEATLRTAGFLGELRISEQLSELSGDRVLEFMRNSWTVFFRHPPTEKVSALAPADRFDIVARGIEKVYEHPDFERFRRVKCYHPVAVVTVDV